MRPTINFYFQTCSCLSIVYNNCSIVPSLFHFSHFKLFTVLTFSLLHYNTELHYTKYKSGFSTNFPKIPKAEWTPVLLNKIWYYRMLQKPSQVVSEQILTLYFRRPNFSSNHLLQRSSYELKCLQSSPQPVWGWGLAALAFKD